MYADYTDYITIYGTDRLPEAEFAPLALKAERTLDLYTTGVDDVRKLEIAFPQRIKDAALVRACFCEIVDMLYVIGQAEKAAEQARGYESVDGALRGKVISSRSAGNESISYSASGSVNQTAVEKAISSESERARAIDGIVRTYLSGVKDANGVNLMFMGRYPKELIPNV